MVCSFCGKRDTRNMIDGLCHACVAFCAGIFEAKQSPPRPAAGEAALELTCSRCKKRWADLEQLMIGPKADVCGACIKKASERMNARLNPRAAPGEAPNLAKVRSGIEYLLLRSAPAGKS